MHVVTCNKPCYLLRLFCKGFSKIFPATLLSVGSSLIMYHSEFIGELIGHSVSEKDRFKPVEHNLISKGTIVLLKEDFTKPYNFPMWIVKDIIKNEMGEVTAAVIRKGSNREIVKRHSSTLIPLLDSNLDFNSEPDSNSHSVPDVNISHSTPRVKRKAAIKSTALTRQILND